MKEHEYILLVPFSYIAMVVVALNHCCVFADVVILIMLADIEIYPRSSPLRVKSQCSVKFIVNLKAVYVFSVHRMFNCFSTKTRHSAFNSSHPSYKLYYRNFTKLQFPGMQLA